VLELALHQQAGTVDGEVRGDAGGRGVRAVGRAEGVVHVAGAEGRQAAREAGVVRRLTRVEADVLQQQHLARGQGRRLRRGVGADRVGGEAHAAGQQFGQPVGDRAQ